MDGPSVPAGLSGGLWSGGGAGRASGRGPEGSEPRRRCSPLSTASRPGPGQPFHRRSQAGQPERSNVALTGVRTHVGHCGASWKPQKTGPPAAWADADSRPSSVTDWAATWTQLLFLNLDSKFPLSGFSKVGVTCDVRKHPVRGLARGPRSINASPQDACAPLCVRALRGSVCILKSLCRVREAKRTVGQVKP